MVLIQDAGFEKPKGKTRKNKYVQLDFSVSVKELEDLAKELTKQSWGDDKGWEDRKWICVAFMEKCQCKYCKPGWEAYEKASKKVK